MSMSAANFNSGPQSHSRGNAAAAGRDSMLQRLAERVPGFLYQFRMYPDGRSCFPYASSGVEAIYEVTPEEVEQDATTVFERLHPDDYDRVVESIRVSFERLAPWSLTYRVALPARGVRWLEGQSVPERLPDGSVLWHGHIHDITERVETEQRLAAASQRLALATKAGGVGIWEFDLKTGLMVWDDITCVLHGIEPGTFDGTLDTWLQTLHTDDRDNALTTGKPMERQYRVVHPDGSVRFLQDNGVVQFDANGDPTGMIGVHWDLTDRRALESQLRQAQKMEAIGQLAGGIAHDFNNLLMTILGNLELARGPRAALEDGDRQPLKEAEIAARRAAELTHRLLAFSRRQHINPIRCAMADIVNNALAVLRRTLGEDVAIAFTDLVPDAVVRADAGPIEQCLMNLCINARDAMPNGGEIAITLYRESLKARDAKLELEPGSYVVTRVRDSGAGMSEATLKQVFEPFFTTKEVGKGTGLGLSMVYGTVKQHKGAITVESEVGRGTTFDLYLPEVASAEARAHIVRRSNRAVPGGNETILVAEDEPSLRVLCKRLLERQGYTVILAVDGKDAIRVVDAEADRIDLALLDFLMPGCNGGAVARHLQALRPDMPFLFMTGHTARGENEAVASEFKADVLYKPYQTSDLLYRVRESLDARK